MTAKNHSLQAPSTSPRSQGRTYVDLLCCLERASQAAETRYPGVDHLRVCHDQPAAAVITQLAQELRSVASESLADSFDLWRGRAHDFDAAAAGLDELRKAFDRQVPALDRTEYQMMLRARILEVQRCRQALEAATDHLEDELATELDSLLSTRLSDHPR